MGYILSLEAVQKVIGELRNNNKIIYTHGAYDLFHNGHLEFLRLSKEQGQILIVGVDSDELLPIYKNVKRPVVPLNQRINIISKLNYVDFVFPIKYINKIDTAFGLDNLNDYQLSIYKFLKPDVITHGRIYAGMRTINEARFKLKNTKFKKIIHKYSNLQSSTKIIDKILSSQN
jgi:cytidyltransferase-like protein